ncbi:hypothetical protein DBR42_01520, partial [Pelomonas sp. HMWF004]
MSAVRTRMENGLNDYMRQIAGSGGISFKSGSLSGDLDIIITPQMNGTALLRLGGISYDAYTEYSGKKFGIISINCVNHASLSGIQVTAQYGTTNGSMPSDSVGLTANNIASSTDCDSNLSWILPILGDMIINRAEGKANQFVADGLTGALTQFKDDLFFGRRPSENYLTGLNKLVPTDKTVRLPDGTPFPIGQYVSNNLAYLIGNSQMSIRINRFGARMLTVGSNFWDAQGIDPPSVLTGDLIAIKLSAPGMAFDITLQE